MTIDISTPPPSRDDDEVRDALDTARAMAEAGVPVFVAPRDPSSPLGVRLPDRWQETTPNPAVVDSWRPGDALCAVTGVLFDAADVDPRHNGDESADALRAAGIWPMVYGRALTPSGGTHDIIACLGVGSRNNVQPGLDVKAGRKDGTGRGFIFIAPTVRISKVTGQYSPYVWEIDPNLDELDGQPDGSGDALADLVGTRRTPTAPKQSGGTGGQFDSPARTFTMDQAAAYCRPLMEALRHAQDGEINQRLNDAAVCLGHFVPAFWSYDDAAEWLLEAVSHTVYDGKTWKAGNTIASGLTAGMKDPYDLVQPMAEVLAVEDEDCDEEVKSSWADVDLGPILDGTYVPATPTLLPRMDGVCLLYRGYVHSMHGESESGKSMIVQAEAARILRETDESVLYIDFESDAVSVVDRLRKLGAPVNAIRERLWYKQPDASPTDAASLEYWREMFRRKPALVVIDGVTEALTSFGKKTGDNDEITDFIKLFPRRLARRTGAAVVLIDHVTKSGETRGRFAIGGQAKMAALDGAAYIIDVIEPMGKGMRGVLSIRIGKDKAGDLRRHGGRMLDDRSQHIAQFILDDTEGRNAWCVEVFTGADDRNVSPRDRISATMEALSTLIEENRGISKNKLRTDTGMHNEERYAKLLGALDTLTQEGYIEVVEGKPRNGTYYASIKPYRRCEDPASAHYAPVTILDPSGATQPLPPLLTPTPVRGADVGVHTSTPLPSSEGGGEEEVTPVDVPRAPKIDPHEYGRRLRMRHVDGLNIDTTTGEVIDG